MFTLKILFTIRVYQFLVPQSHAALSMNNMGLTEIPKNIPCIETKISLANNNISRIERDSFVCLNAVVSVRINKNNLSYIHEEAFHPLKSLVVLVLSDNPHLVHLPADFGPAANNLGNLRIQYINLQSLPANFFQQFGAMKTLSAMGWGLTEADDDLFRGLVKVGTLRASGLGVLPNLTNRLPVLTNLLIEGFIEGNVVEGNTQNLYKLEKIEIRAPCNDIRLLSFKGAPLVTKYDVSGCAVREIPDLTHMTALQSFSMNTSRYQCTPTSCWMLFEDLSNNPGLAWLRNVTCHGLERVARAKIRDLSPVQTHCFTGE